MNGSRILVCGGRDFTDYEYLSAVLDLLSPNVVIEGGARGADEGARQWARKNNRECITEPAEWGKHGKAAGLLRNQKMLDVHKPLYVLAFPGGRGTADMVRRAKAAQVMVKIVPPKYEGWWLEY